MIREKKAPVLLAGALLSGDVDHSCTTKRWMYLRAPMVMWTICIPDGSSLFSSSVKLVTP